MGAGVEVFQRFVRHRRHVECLGGIADGAVDQLPHDAFHFLSVRKGVGVADVLGIPGVTGRNIFVPHQRNIRCRPVPGVGDQHAVAHPADNVNVVTLHVLYAGALVGHREYQRIGFLAGGLGDYPLQVFFLAQFGKSRFVSVRCNGDFPFVGEVRIVGRTYFRGEPQRTPVCDFDLRTESGGVDLYRIRDFAGSAFVVVA